MPDFKTSSTTGAPKVVMLSDEELAWRKERLSVVKAPLASAKRIFIYRDPTRAEAGSYPAWAQANGKELVFPSGKSDAEDLVLLQSCDAAVIPGASAKKFASMWGGKPKLQALTCGGMLSCEDGQQILATMADVLWRTYSMTELNTIAAGDFAAVADIPFGVGPVCDDMSVEIKYGEIFAAKKGETLQATGDLGDLRPDGVLCVTGRKAVERSRAA